MRCTHCSSPLALSSASTLPISRLALSYFTQLWHFSGVGARGMWPMSSPDRALTVSATTVSCRAQWEGIEKLFTSGVTAAKASASGAIVGLSDKHIYTFARQQNRHCWQQDLAEAGCVPSIFCVSMLVFGKCITPLKTTKWHAPDRGRDMSLIAKHHVQCHMQVASR